MKVQIKLNIEEVINIELYPEYAPKSVANFLELVKKGYYKDTCFHRVIKGFMIQTGGYKIESNTLKELPEVKTIKGEFSSNGFKNDLKHELGVISMARTSDPNSASSQFFICAGTAKWLDGEYAAFGKTCDEQSNEVVLKIAGMPTMNIGGGFSDFPQYDIHIEDVVITEE